MKQNTIFDPEQGDVPFAVALLATMLTAQSAAFNAAFASMVQTATHANAPALRYLGLTDAKTDAGIPLAAAAATGSMGILRTAGTSLQLGGEATSGSAKTNKAMWELNLPSSYVAGANIPVVVNCIVTGSGTLTGASSSMTLTAYSEVNGVETALTVSAAQLFDKTGETLTFTITGTGLVPGAHLVIEAAALVTTSAGACTGFINSIGYAA